MRAGAKTRGMVVLGGGGGDELFGGYSGNELQRREYLSMPLQRLPHWFRSRLPGRVTGRLHVIKDFSAAIASLYQGETPRRQAVAKEMQELLTACGVNSYMDVLMFNGLYTSSGDGNYRLPDILGLQEQVEVRSPFLDYRLVEFAATLPHALKIRNPATGETNKWIPKCLYEKYVPKDIAWARKKGMGWNLRWDKSVAFDSEYESFFRQALTSFERIKFDTQEYSRAFEQFRKDKRDAPDSAPHSGNIVATVLMQGAWLLREIKHST